MRCRAGAPWKAAWPTKCASSCSTTVRKRAATTALCRSACSSMWEFYLAGCEVAFRYMNQMVFQIQIARNQDAVPLTRDYVNEAENGKVTSGPRATRSIAAE